MTTIRGRSDAKYFLLMAVDSVVGAMHPVIGVSIRLARRTEMKQ
jgi:hypothetical protein